MGVVGRGAFLLVSTIKVLSIYPAKPMTMSVSNSLVRANVTFRSPSHHGLVLNFLDQNLDDLNKNMLAGRDKEPNLSRIAASGLPCTLYSVHTAMSSGSVESAVFVGGSMLHTARLRSFCSRRPGCQQAQKRRLD